jgi:hypothetical protein
LDFSSSNTMSVDEFHEHETWKILEFIVLQIHLNRSNDNSRIAIFPE